MDTIFALSTPKKVKDLGRRINREVTRVSSTNDLLKKIDLEEEQAFILVDLAMPLAKKVNFLEDITKIVGDIPVLLLKDFATFVPGRLAGLGFAKGNKPKQRRKHSSSKQLFPALHNPKTARIDAKLIAGFFQLPLAKIAKSLNSSPKTVHKTPDAVSLQEGLSVLLRIACALMDMFGLENDARVWLNTPCSGLDNTPPMEFIKQGQSEVIADLLEDLLLGHPG